MKRIQQSPSLWTETYWHEDFLFLILDQYSITCRDENPRNASCIQSNFVSKCKVSWEVHIAVTLSESHILQRGRTSLFSLMLFISFFLPMTVVKTSFFSQMQLRVGHFATSWDQVQWPGARPSCVIMPLSPSPRQLSSCLSSVSVPRGQWKWSLHLKKGVIYGKITVKPTHKKGQTQAWEQRGMVSALC